MTTIDDVSEPLDESTERIGNLPFVIRPGKPGERGLGGLSVIVWDGAAPRVCDIAHKMLWNRLVAMYRFFEDHFELAEPGIAERWAMVRDFVLKGDPLDVNVYAETTKD